MKSLGIEFWQSTEEVNLKKEIWEGLYQASGASPYLSHDWFTTAMKYFQGDNRLWVGVVKIGKQPVPIVPLDPLSGGYDQGDIHEILLKAKLLSITYPQITVPSIKLVMGYEKLDQCDRYPMQPFLSNKEDLQISACRLHRAVPVPNFPNRYTGCCRRAAGGPHQCHL